MTDNPLSRRLFIAKAAPLIAATTMPAVIGLAAPVDPVEHMRAIIRHFDALAPDAGRFMIQIGGTRETVGYAAYAYCAAAATGAMMLRNCPAAPAPDPSFTHLRNPARLQALEWRGRMFFTRLARIVAFLVIAAGAYNLVVGFLIANGTIAPMQEALARYLPASATTGEAIDKGALYLAIAVALGTLAEISARLQKI